MFFPAFWQSNLQYPENKDTSLGRCLKINQNYFLLTRKYFKICKYILHISGLNTYLNSQKPNGLLFGSVIFQGALGYPTISFIPQNPQKNPCHTVAGIFHFCITPKGFAVGWHCSTLFQHKCLQSFQMF